MYYNKNTYKKKPYKKIDIGIIEQKKNRQNKQK